MTPPAGRPGDTIFALSSGALPAAIAVVRVSGPAATAALTNLTGRGATPRRATVRGLYAADGSLLDRALLLFFPGPHTATGEDLVELHLHGGRAVAAAVLAALAEIPGYRSAEAGEFTRRAFVNGRLDLIETEGLADLLSAETEGQRRQALRLAEGGLRPLIESWREGLLIASARVEAAIEFGEDEEDVPALSAADMAAIARLAAELGETLQRNPAERLKDGVRIVLAGPVNAGKSSLLNALAGRDAAITADIEGTTRDLIEVPVAIEGIPLLLIDGAGLRESTDPIERAGMARIRNAMAGGDLLIWMGDPDDAPEAPSVLRLHSRADLPSRAEIPAGADIAVSVRTGRGLAELRALIVSRARQLLPQESQVALNQRHRELVRDMKAQLDGIFDGMDAVLIAEHLRLARAAVDRLTGAAGVEEMLDALFGRFCIGK